MNKLPVLICMALGAIVGLFTAISDGIGLKLVMLSIGVVAGQPLVVHFLRKAKRSGQYFTRRMSYSGREFQRETD